MPQRFLTALPVFNEVSHVEAVLKEVRRYSPDVLVVDDGSRDGTAEVLARQQGLHLVTHPQNRGYGAALKSAFAFAADRGYETIITIDCDGQHQPQRIPKFVDAIAGVDIVSGSRYLQAFAGDTPPPEERRLINRELTRELNRRLGLHLTDAFCGFKAYRIEAIQSLRLSEDGYAMPLELWVQVAHHRLRVIEVPVPLIYLDEKRSFGGSLDDARIRLQHYYEVIDRAQAAVETHSVDLPAGAPCGDVAG
jgi:dolichol-phosphate mannosyltransferase